MENKREYPALQRVKRASSILTSLNSDPWSSGWLAEQVCRFVIDEVTSLELAFDVVLHDHHAVEVALQKYFSEWNFFEKVRVHCTQTMFYPVHMESNVN